MTCVSASQASDEGAVVRRVRLRFAWGGGTSASQLWRGVIAADGARIVDLQPLGIEADEAAAVRLVGGQVLVDPLVGRAFDGCDATVELLRQDATLSVKLGSASAVQPVQLQFGVAEAAASGYRSKLDEAGGSLVVSRSPGDRLRIVAQRDALVFSPGESWSFGVQADLSHVTQDESLTLEAALVRLADGENVWKTSTPLARSDAVEQGLTLTLPPTEGVYRVELAVRRPEALSRRLVQFEATAPVATRSWEVVVVDPSTRRPALVADAEPELRFDPASPSWRQRIPSWAQLPALPQLPRLRANSLRPLGDSRPVLRSGPEDTTLIELAPLSADGWSSWQAYELSLAAPGQPYVVEVAVPCGVPQHLTLCLVERDEAGRIAPPRQATAFLASDAPGTVAEGIERRRWRVWPRTSAPLLAVANASATHSARYGVIALYRERPATTPPETPPEASADAAADQLAPSRVMAAYVAEPGLVQSFATPTEFDPLGQLSVDSWSTFWEGGVRLIQQLRSDQYNAAIVNVCGEGSALAPLEGLACSPRFDTRPLGATRPDPLRKDVLELWLRMFAAERLMLAPAVRLAEPLAGLERLREAYGVQIEWIGDDGQTWQARHGAAVRAPHYNLLHPAVQEALLEQLDALVARYAQHPSFGGLALQLPGDGFGVLPGLAWGLDDDTIQRFEQATGQQVPGTGPGRFAARAAYVTGPGKEVWKTWRAAEITALYQRVARRLQERRPEARLVLCFEDVLSHPVVAEAARHVAAGGTGLNEALLVIGVDWPALAKTPGIVATRPSLHGVDDAWRNRPYDLPWNRAVELDDALAGAQLPGRLCFYRQTTIQLRDFDAWGQSTTIAWPVASCPVGDDSRRAVIAALTAADPRWLVMGTSQGLHAQDPSLGRFAEIFRQLPGTAAEVRAGGKQPIAARAYRYEGATTVALTNPAPWPVRVEVRLETGDAAQVAWRLLGQASQAAPSPDAAASGTLTDGTANWTVDLAPFDLVAWRFAAPRVRIGAVQATVAQPGIAALTTRLEDIEARLRNLDLEREFTPLKNPDFEAAPTESEIPGWQIRAGLAGSATLDAAQPYAGQYCAHLRSTDAVGVGLQSHRFALPVTGQLLVRARVRTSAMAPDAILYGLLEFDAPGGVQRRYVVFASADAPQDAWTHQELAVADLPLAPRGQARVQFLLTGAGQAWIDDVALTDVWFNSPQRVELVKRLYAARSAFDDGQVLECLDLVSDYWPRYLVEFVPPRPASVDEGAAPRVDVAAREPAAPPAPPKAEEAPGIGDRLRGMMPRIWR